MRQTILPIIGMLMLGVTTAARAEDVGSRPATGLKTVTSGDCDGRTAALEIVRSNDGVEGPARVTAILDGRRQPLRPDGPFLSLFTRLNEPTRISLVCTPSGVNFEFFHATGVQPGEAGDAPQILSSYGVFGLNWPTGTSTD